MEPPHHRVKALRAVWSPLPRSVSETAANSVATFHAALAGVAAGLHNEDLVHAFGCEGEFPLLPSLSTLEAIERRREADRAARLDPATAADYVTVTPGIGDRIDGHVVTHLALLATKEALHTVTTGSNDSLLRRSAVSPAPATHGVTHGTTVDPFAVTAPATPTPAGVAATPPPTPFHAIQGLRALEIDVFRQFHAANEAWSTSGGTTAAMALTERAWLQAQQAGDIDACLTATVTPLRHSHHDPTSMSRTRSPLSGVHGNAALPLRNTARPIPLDAGLNDSFDGHPHGTTPSPPANVGGGTCVEPDVLSAEEAEFLLHSKPSAAARSASEPPKAQPSRSPNRDTLDDDDDEAHHERSGITGRRMTKPLLSMVSDGAVLRPVEGGLTAVSPAMVQRLFGDDGADAAANLNSTGAHHAVMPGSPPTSGSVRSPDVMAADIAAASGRRSGSGGVPGHSIGASTAGAATGDVTRRVGDEDGAEANGGFPGPYGKQLSTWYVPVPDSVRHSDSVHHETEFRRNVHVVPGDRPIVWADAAMTPVPPALDATMPLQSRSTSMPPGDSLWSDQASFGSPVPQSQLPAQGSGGGGSQTQRSASPSGHHFSGSDRTAPPALQPSVYTGDSSDDDTHARIPTVAVSGTPPISPHPRPRTPSRMELQGHAGGLHQGNSSQQRSDLGRGLSANSRSMTPELILPAQTAAKPAAASPSKTLSASVTASNAQAWNAPNTEATQRRYDERASCDVDMWTYGRSLRRMMQTWEMVAKGFAEEGDSAFEAGNAGRSSDAAMSEATGVPARLLARRNSAAPDKSRHSHTAVAASARSAAKGENAKKPPLMWHPHMGHVTHGGIGGWARPSNTTLRLLHPAAFDPRAVASCVFVKRRPSGPVGLQSMSKVSSPTGARPLGGDWIAEPGVAAGQWYDFAAPPPFHIEAYCDVTGMPPSLHPLDLSEKSCFAVTEGNGGTGGAAAEGRPSAESATSSIEHRRTECVGNEPFAAAPRVSAGALTTASTGTEQRHEPLSVGRGRLQTNANGAIEDVGGDFVPHEHRTTRPSSWHHPPSMLPITVCNFARELHMLSRRTLPGACSAILPKLLRKALGKDGTSLSPTALHGMQLQLPLFGEYEYCLGPVRGERFWVGADSPQSRDGEMRDRRGDNDRDAKKTNDEGDGGGIFVSADSSDFVTATVVNAAWELQPIRFAYRSVPGPLTHPPDVTAVVEEAEAAATAHASARSPFAASRPFSTGAPTRSTGSPEKVDQGKATCPVVDLAAEVRQRLGVIEAVHSPCRAVEEPYFDDRRWADARLELQEAISAALRHEALGDHQTNGHGHAVPKVVGNAPTGAANARPPSVEHETLRSGFGGAGCGVCNFSGLSWGRLHDLGTLDPGQKPAPAVARAARHLEKETAGGLCCTSNNAAASTPPRGRKEDNFRACSAGMSKPSPGAYSSTSWAEELSGKDKATLTLLSTEEAGITAAIAEQAQAREPTAVVDNTTAATNRHGESHEELEARLLDVAGSARALRALAPVNSFAVANDGGWQRGWVRVACARVSLRMSLSVTMTSKGKLCATVHAVDVDVPRFRLGVELDNGAVKSAVLNGIVNASRAIARPIIEKVVRDSLSGAVFQ